MTDSDEYITKFEIYQDALFQCKKSIERKLQKKEKINYEKIVQENLIYDPDLGISKDVILDLKERMIVELKYN
jgi:hypothetical protein